MECLPPEIWRVVISLLSHGRSWETQKDLMCAARICLQMRQHVKNFLLSREGARYLLTSEVGMSLTDSMGRYLFFHTTGELVYHGEENYVD